MDFSDFCSRVRQSGVTSYVEVNVAGNWADTSAAVFTPVGYWLIFHTFNVKL